MTTRAGVLEQPSAELGAERGDLPGPLGSDDYELVLAAYGVGQLVDRRLAEVAYGLVRGERWTDMAARHSAREDGMVRERTRPLCWACRSEHGFE